ncbi:magnesium or manganese-dependent protein phosphatase [Streptomyces zinciresistens K42]|uniref:Magnesium or manganese-dependent protein phosphatase n=1 Tax=Streptomyces zinciresistens K42 TaxID=700597 RepID=G2GPC2_9ACTN|nr:SpoIIE family protein phosphatase [Streptomyces zinciresistens]EGX54641.1 magnesium or manganese-dependent protein phosphatase [Streptomyces zinciresistens K42]
MSREYPFDEAATARAVVDASGVLVEWNAGAERLLGHRAADVVGRPALDLLADGQRTGPGAPRGDRWDGVLTLRRRDGGEEHVWLLAHRVRAAGGGPDRWLVVTPLDADGPRPPGDPLDHVGLLDSPCAIAIYDDRLRLRRMNTGMAEILGLAEEQARGLRAPELTGRPQSREFERHLLRVLTTGLATDVRTYVPVGNERTYAWLARMAPVTDAKGRVRGVSVAAHDFTDQYAARERLQLVNEASVRIGTTLDVTATAQELADICVPALADFISVDLLDPPEHGDSPAGAPAAPVTLRRTAHRSVHADSPEAVVAPGRVDVYPSPSPQAAALLAGHTIVASVSTGDLEEWLSWDRARAERIKEYGIHTSMSVPIQARGTTLGVAVLTRFRNPEGFTPDDILLAEEITARAAVCIDNARRYSRERETAIALQRSLLPRSLPRTAALEAASRYLPAARSGVGGDWFDVIPLSGMRVAMVVGDVVGHGIQASATMGRLRTAVRTLADIDLAPDELLTHLDDLVVRLSEEAGTEGGSGEVGATCLYAVYDPVARRCTLARAGHPSPVVMPPGGSPREVVLPAGPPLGLGGLPFESAEIELAEGTVLALYTDGLIETRERDADAGLALLREALARDAGSLEETCDRVLRSLLPPGGVADDVALLLARTQGLPSTRVATWDIPADPALVAAVRKQVVEQLEVWRLTEASFTAELVVSELVTNAIRYGNHPIRLRLIHDATTLICEVSDTSHTAPHLRRAKTFDEGGRGLLLVAQLTQRWGSRHTADGKTIWAEISLLDEG